ncbi:MAG: metallophosphoesterase family protein [Coriobacteriia bacterium]|nr:metallophosphoesterase family protein [Coriobacteriia bacterium]
MRRIAIYSDVHGNVSAMEAVAASMEAEGLSERYCLGDLVGLGPRPDEAVALVRSYGDKVIQGNYDRAIGAHLCSPGSEFPTTQEALDGAESYAYTIAETSREAADYLFVLPRDLRLEEGGASILLCHGTPRLISGLLGPDTAGPHLVSLARAAEADVVCCGHLHVPFHRSIPTEAGVVHWVNVGSVGRPRDGDPRAAWVELVIGTQGEVVEHAPADTACRRIADLDLWLGVTVHRVAYNIDAVVREMTQKGLPATLAHGLKLGLEEHDVAADGSIQVVDVGALENEIAEPVGTALTFAESTTPCTCFMEDRIAAYEALVRILRGEISEVSIAVRRLRIAMRSCRVHLHVDEAAIVASFEAADRALLTAAGRAAFEEERDRLYGLRTGFDPFANVLSPDEVTYLSGEVEEHREALERMYREAAFTVPILPGSLRSSGHIATELAFLAHCLRGAEAGVTQAPERAQEFFAQHLSEWGVLFAVVVGQQTSEPVMRYAGLALDKFLACEAGIFRHAFSEMCSFRIRRG